VSEKKPNKNDEEDQLNFEDRVLTLLANLRHNLERFQDSTDSMQREIREFRTSIHGEDTDE